MTKIRIYNYDDKDLPTTIRNVLNVMLNDNKVSNKNSLHDIFKSKGLQCFCTECYENKVYNRNII